LLTTEVTVEAKVAEVWVKMDKNQRSGVRFGMFPAEVMKEVEKTPHHVKII
jgi:hypothetical protein